MIVLSLHADIVEYLRERRLTKKFDKQIKLVTENPGHPSLNLELLEPKNLRFYSFRIDLKYRAIFIFRNETTIEIIDVNNHYR